MTIIDQFVKFAREMPAKERESLEATLAALMNTYSGQFEFALEEIAEIERRRSIANAAFADDAEIEQLFGKPLPR